MKKLMYGVCMLSGLIALSACNDDNPWMGPAGRGGISLNVKADGYVQDAVPQTRADALFTVPDANDFSIKLEKNDGSYSKIFPTVEDFKAEDGFPTGVYTISAFYGNPEDEGFDLPYFEGVEQVTVLEAREAEVSITSKVANSLVSLDYTENFKNYMTAYSARLHSEGHSYVDIPAEETRPAFVAPGNVGLTVSFTNPQGQSVTIQPTEFIAVGGHHYHITLDVNGGNVGVASLVVSFDNSLAKEDVTIDLTDELFTSPAPSVKTQGFNSGDEVEFLAGEAPADKYRFNVISHGGLKEVNLTIASDSYTPPFGKEINLMEAGETQQQQLAELGIDVKGIFKNPDRMAYIDISELPMHLPAGKYTVSVVAKDNFTRVSEPGSVTFTAVAPTLEVTPLSAMAGINQGSLEVSYNGSNPQKDITFKAQNKNGIFVDAPVTSCTDATRTRSIPVNNYIFTIKLPDTEHDPIPVKVFLYGKEVKTVNLKVEEPSYTLDADGFATKAYIKVIASDDQVALITANIRLFKDGAAVPAANIVDRNTDTGIITITGLQPNNDYVVKGTLRSSTNDNSPSVSFHTESNLQLANGGFDQVERTIDATINSGGQYKAGSSNSRFVYNTADVVVDVPLRSTGWATLNPLTYFTGASPQNTWFMVPSTFMNSDGAVVIRSVAYSHEGVEPEGASNGGLSTKYYNGTAPDFQYRISGELFLGSYDFTGTANRKDGINFASRPSSVTFDYSYVPYNNEMGDVYVAVVDAAGNVIASKTVNITSASNSSMTVTLPEYEYGRKAASLRISFRSSNGPVSTKVPSGDDLNERYDADNSVLNAHVSPPAGGSFHVPNNLYKALSTGSVLTVDNVKLNY